MTCRSCQHPLSHTFCNLGTTPLANSYLDRAQLPKPETHFPLHAFVCERCLLVQLEAYETPEGIFSDYAYFSSYADTWLSHARKYAYEIVARLKLTPSHQVIEVASNDGYLLRYIQEQGIPVLGIEPARNVAQTALDKGIPTRVDFFGVRLAKALLAENTRCDLLIANNVLAHVPDLNDFVAGMKLLLSPNGTITIEFHYLLQLIAKREFDTIYHEHFSYFSLHALMHVFARHHLTVYDVEMLTTHGGSLRLYCCHEGRFSPTPRVADLLALEKKEGLDQLNRYLHFGTEIETVKQTLLSMLHQFKREGKRIAAYGAPAKGNTLLNYCGIGPELIEFTVDRNPHKQGKFLPGSRIPILAPEAIAERKPDIVLILPWNLKDEISAQLSFVREYGGQLMIPIPTPMLLP